MKSELTYEEAHRLFRYDAETGELFWKVSMGRRVKAGAEAGAARQHGRTRYRQVGVSGKLYYVHRIIWLMLYGEWPKHGLDHIDGCGTNNRSGNLRDVPCVDNQRNQRMRHDNTSGVTGVFWETRRGKWRAQSSGDSGRKHLGYYDNIRDAEKAVLEYHAGHGYTARHGIAL